MANHKATTMRDDVAAEFAIRRSSLTLTKSFDASQNACLLAGAASAGAEGFFLRIKPATTLQKDVLGLDQTVYAPLVAQLVFEANFAGTTDNVADVQVWASKLAIIGMLAARGIKLEVYEETNGTVPSASSIVVGKLKATFDVHPQYPGAGQ